MPPADASILIDQPVVSEPAPRATGLSHVDLEELFAEFNNVTSRLHETHDKLTAKVTRLESELQDANDQLHRSSELAALGEMAAGMAHEIRNPLGSISLYASHLEEDLADRPSERAVATKIGSAVRGLDQIVTDILSFARELKLRPTPVDAHELLLLAFESCKPLADAQQIEMSLAGDMGESLTVLCDPSLIRQALINLIRNSIEAIADEGVTGKEPAHIELAVESRSLLSVTGELENVVALCVRDNGPGIPEDARQRIFNPFFTTRPVGTGLGLAIVHRIIDAHNGRVIVSDISGESEHCSGGAIVELLLPHDETQHQQSVPYKTNRSARSRA